MSMFRVILFDSILYRSDKAGKLLAEVLLKGLQGHRYASGKEEIVIILI